MMTGEQLEEAGILLFGKYWKTPLARALDLNPVTLWRYQVSGNVPLRVRLAVEHLLREKENGPAKLNQLQGRFPGH